MKKLSLLLALSALTAVASAKVVTGDTFNVAVVGFNAAGAGAYLVGPLTATFGGTQTFAAAGLGGVTVTVASVETIGATQTTDSVTISVPANFIPTGSTISGSPVTQIEYDLAGYNAGTNAIDLTTAIAAVSTAAAPTSTSTTGSSLYGTNSTITLTPVTTLSNGNAAFASAEGLNAGGADLAAYNIRSFTYSITYANPVPELSALAALGLGAVAVLRRRSKKA